MACLFCERGTLRLKNPLLTNAKARVCYLDYQVQAPLLLRHAPHHSGIQVPPWRSHLEP
jgi:hypothetical protein